MVKIYVELLKTVYACHHTGGRVSSLSCESNRGFHIIVGMRELQLKDGNGRGPLVTRLKSTLSKRKRSSSILILVKHRPTKVNCITKTLSSYNNVHSR